MSKTARWIIAIISGICAIGLLVSIFVIQPKGKELFSYLAIIIFCIFVVVAFLSGPLQGVSFRILSTLVFTLFLVFLIKCLIKLSLDNWQDLARLKGPLICFLVFGLPGLYVSLTGRLPFLTQVFVLPVDPNDPIMCAAIQRARETIQTLRELFAFQKYEIWVKYPYNTSSGTTEHVWGLLVELSGNVMYVTMETIPTTDEPYLPSSLSLPLSELEDWQVNMPDGTIRGGFTTKAQIEIAERDGFDVPYQLRGVDKKMVDS